MPGLFRNLPHYKCDKIRNMQFVKSIWAGIFPRTMSYDECFRRAKEAGFDGIELTMAGEIGLGSSAEQARELGNRARASRIAIASLWVSALNSSPLNSPSPEIRSRGVEAIRKAIEFAAYLDCGALLLVPGRVGAGPKLEVGYQATWDRFTAELKKVIPDAERAKVILTIENVSNRFLLSPLEMRAFVDQFASPWLQAHFDTGNVMYTGYPQDWILTLGPRIKRVHIKDRKASPSAEHARPSALLEGEVDWAEVIAALRKVGYHGYLTPEIAHDPNDPGQLQKVSKALDQILDLA